MRTHRLLIALASLAMAFGSAMAQSPVDEQHAKLLDSHKFLFFGEGDADSTAYLQLLDRFYMDQFRHAQDPRASYFMLMSRSGKLAMGIGGHIKAVGDYDWHGSIDGGDFCPYLIPMTIDPAGVNQMQTSIGGTALFFSVFGTDDHFGNYQLYIEGKFSGTASHYFKLSKAYATVGDWTLGLAKSTFADPGSQPSTVDSEGPNSEVDDSRFLLRYMRPVSKHVTLALSAEMPDYSIPTAAGLYEPGKVYMPDFGAFVQYGWGKQHVRLSGIVKSMRYRNLVKNQNEYATAWGVNLTTIFRPVAPLTVYAAVNTGEGISSMVNDLSCGITDLIALDNEPGKLYAPRSYGWYGALQYNYSSSVFSTLIFSQERMLPKKDAAYADADYKYGLYGTANVFWNITPRCQVGAEVNVGKRVDMSGDHRMAYRASLLAEYSF